MVWRPYVSFNIWTQFESPVGQEHWHCDMKRGFARARKKELLVKALLQKNTMPQDIGLLAQRGIYEFHQDIKLLSQSNGFKEVAEKLELNQKPLEVQQRVIQILKKYQENPILLNKTLITLSSGDEGIPTPILIKQGNYYYNLFAAIDCICVESDDRIHILDFKTGTSNFDRRQAFVYLLAASYLYPQRKAVVSFYNLETGNCSELITATDSQLKAIQDKLAQIAKAHNKELSFYKQNPSQFADIFPPNPGNTCRNCQFASICQFSPVEVAA